MSLPSITPLPTPPSRGMTPDAFAVAAEAWMAALATYQSEVNALSTALAAALGYQTIGTLTTTSGTTQDVSSLQSTVYNDLLFVPLGVSFTTAVNVTMALSNNGSSFTTAQAVSASAAAASDTFYGAVFMPGFRKNGGFYGGGLTPLSADLTTGAPGALGRNWRLNGGINTVRFGGGTFDAGSILVLGKQ
jgi:hypothetical protein